MYSGEFDGKRKNYTLGVAWPTQDMKTSESSLRCFSLDKLAMAPIPMAAILPPTWTSIPYTQSILDT